MHLPFAELTGSSGLVDSAGIESMDCSVGRGALGGPGLHPVVDTWIRGERLEAIIDTGCSHTLFQSKLAPFTYIQKATPVKVTCMHGHSTFYPEKVYQVTILSTTQEIPFGLEWDPCF